MTLDISGLVGNINVPTTVIVGDADKVENEPLLRRELASRISGTEFIILPGVSHLSPLEAPSELAAAITTAVSNISWEAQARGWHHPADRRGCLQLDLNMMIDIAWQASRAIASES